MLFANPNQGELSFPINGWHNRYQYGRGASAA